MHKILSFLKDFFDALAKMAMIIFVASCVMVFVAGLLMAYAGWPFNYAMGTILLPAVAAIVIAAYVAYIFTWGREKAK